MKQIAIVTTVLVLFIVLAVSCSDSPTSDSKNITEQELEEGFTLAQTYCSVCHTPPGNSSTRIAPPFQAVKRHYISSKTSQKEFTNALLAFFKNPTVEHSKMPGAVEKFGLMPKLEIEEEKLTKIAQYLYNADLSNSKWRSNQKISSPNTLSNLDTSSTLIEQGKTIAMQTKAILGKNLMGAIQTKGAEGAVEFCNTRAIHLTDSMGNYFTKEVKRVSDKPRNLINLATEPFLSKITEYKKSLANGTELKGGSLEWEGSTYTYYPITTNKMCLQCHGKKDSEIKPNTLAKINKMYPNDKATGYSENELRGIWVIKMD